MCWADLLVLPAAPYRLAAFLFAALFHHLWHLVSSRYIFLLIGGCLLASTATGSYAVLLHIPATGSMLVLLSISPACAHTWVFALQMSWQTLCHLVLSTRELDPQAVALSAIMLFTQKATSLALDIHEGLMLLQLGQGLLQLALPLCSYLLFFPALLGGPLCSFSRFQAQAEYCGALPCSLRAAGQQCLCALALQGLAGELATGRAAPDWTFLSTTTHRLAVFTQTWNKSTSCCLRRLVFQRFPAQPRLVTFAFSAWWHGLRPGQVFGVLCWAVMVEADYRSHPFLGAWATSQGMKLLYRGTTWVFTQLIVAYILVAVETESFSVLCLLWTSCNSILPLSYGLTLLLLLLAKKPKQN
uniref:Membrane bound O-acyltransferase domain containing 4 n=1 Tax=Aquila chrysaetos chrysaetos TaxID=223781 RepID=A0A663DZZ6_AQUCH